MEPRLEISKQANNSDWISKLKPPRLDPIVPSEVIDRILDGLSTPNAQAEFLTQLFASKKVPHPDRIEGVLLNCFDQQTCDKLLGKSIPYLLEIGETEKAIRILDKKNVPQVAADLCVDRGNIKEAIDLLTRHAEVDNDRRDIWAKIANLNLKIGSWKEAVDAYVKATFYESASKLAIEHGDLELSKACKVLIGFEPPGGFAAAFGAEKRHKETRKRLSWWIDSIIDTARDQKEKKIDEIIEKTDREVPAPLKNYISFLIAFELGAKDIALTYARGALKQYNLHFFLGKDRYNDFLLKCKETFEFHTLFEEAGSLPNNLKERRLDRLALLISDHLDFLIKRITPEKNEKIVEYFKDLERDLSDIKSVEQKNRTCVTCVGSPDGYVPAREAILRANILGGRADVDILSRPIPDTRPEKAAALAAELGLWNWARKFSEFAGYFGVAKLASEFNQDSESLSIYKEIEDILGTSTIERSNKNFADIAREIRYKIP